MRIAFKIKYLIVWSFLYSIYSCTSNSSSLNDQNSVKNLILILADVNDCYSPSIQDTPINEHLNIYRTNEVGYSLFSNIETGSYNHASTASVFSTGFKPHPGSFGVDEKNQAHPNLIELASVKGMLTAFISHSSITNPVSAAFLVHGNYKNDPNSIAMGLLNSPVDILMSCDQCLPSGEDSLILFKNLEKKGYKIYSAFEKKSNHSKFVFLNANQLTNEDSYTNIFKSMKMAIKSMQTNKKGFLLVIDLYKTKEELDKNHRNLNSENIDKILGLAFDFCDNHPESLTIITPLSNQQCPVNSLKRLRPKTNKADMFLPIFSYGCENETFGGIYKGTAVFEKIVNTLKLSDSLIRTENDF